MHHDRYTNLFPHSAKISEAASYWQCPKRVNDRSVENARIVAIRQSSVYDSTSFGTTILETWACARLVEGETLRKGF